MDRLQDILKEYYGLAHPVIVPQQGGWAALAYKVSNGAQDYFLKVYEKSRASTHKWTALIDDYVPILLWLEEHSRLKGSIPVPMLTTDQRYRCEDNKGIYLLYEYIDGDTIADRKLTENQVRQLAQIIAELHRYGEDFPLVTSAMTESFTVPFLGQLREALDAGKPDDIGEVMNPHIDCLMGLMLEVEALSEELKKRDLRLALCHTDVHAWNLMSDGQQLILIDWEGLKLAPVEADMMFFVAEPYFESFMRIYKETHSDYVMNSEALTFYQGRRKLEDIWEFMEQLLCDVQNDEERASTLNSLKKELEEITMSKS
ncbi:aminoglycoside phosphotransferase family protein [Cytobacillus firmus]|uniref:aminoglycoside phosphotransferase family protein n=1 Tax=Paenibacillus lautus TaxID=1401 RepID=UPI00384BCC52|nr:aminoglycoside phosphotransferase family protein [Cytobacillus firmus]